MRDKLQIVEESTNHPNGLTPWPPLLEERGPGGEAQLQFITYFLAQTQRGVS